MHAVRNVLAEEGGREPPLGITQSPVRNKLRESLDARWLPRKQPTFTSLLQPARSGENKTAGSFV